MATDEIGAHVAWPPSVDGRHIRPRTAKVKGNGLPDGHPARPGGFAGATREWRDPPDAAPEGAPGSCPGGRTKGRRMPPPD